jgi:hypothetical protein
MEVSAPYINIVRTPEMWSIVKGVDKGKAKAIEAVPLYKGEPQTTTQLVVVSMELEASM